MRNDCEDLCSCSDNKDPFALLKVSFPLSWAQRDKISKTKAELVWERPTEQEKVFVFITFITSPFSSHQKVSLYSTLSELTQPRAWGALDWRWENSVGLSACLWAQRCHPWPLSLVEWVHQGWRDALSGESRLWRVNICSGISTCCMQWLANCWFAGVIPFSNSRKEKKENPTKTNISTLSLTANHSWYSWLHWGFSFQSRSEMFERPRESRPIFLDVQGHAWSPPPLGQLLPQPTWAQFLATPRPSRSELPLYTLLPLPGDFSSQNPVPSRPRWFDPSSGWNLTHPWKLETSRSSLPLFSLWHCLYWDLHFSYLPASPPGTYPSRARACLIYLCEGVPQALGQFFSTG